MAQRVNIVLTDDLDGSDATQTITFGLDGAEYEIDLSDAHADDLRNALAQYVAAARKSSARGSATRGRRRAASTPASGTSANDIRQWAQEQGMTVSSRGRVPAEVRAAYEAAH